jgi:hypothetical protein
MYPELWGDSWSSLRGKEWSTFFKGVNELAGSKEGVDAD